MMKLSTFARLTLSSSSRRSRPALGQHVKLLSTSNQSSRSVVGQSRLLSKANDLQAFKIVDPDNNLLKQLQPTGSNVELADLECRLPKNRSLSLNLTWLRDSCHCEKCTHKFSRQRLFTPKEFRRELFAIADVQVVSKQEASGYISGSALNGDQDENFLSIKWADGHQSSYSLSWLDEVSSLYEKSQLQVADTRRQSKWNHHILPKDDFYATRGEYESKPQYWSVEDIQANLEPIDCHDLLDGFEFHNNDSTFINANRIGEMSSRRYESIASLVDQLSRFGLAKIVNLERERDQVLKVARSLAYERPTGYGTVFDVVIEPSEEINLAYSSEEFDLHSDLTYREKSPGVQMLHCIKNSVEGGLSFFSDAFHAANILRREDPKLFDVLTEFPAVFVVRDPYRDVKFRRQKPVLTLDYAGELTEVHYSPFMLPPIGHKDDIKLFYLAQDRYTQLLQAKENKLITKLDPGELFIFNNRRVLHGRSSYDPKASDRFLQGCYMDWDEIICLHEKFKSNKAH